MFARSLNVITAIIVLALVICGINRMLFSEECYYTNYNQVVCEK